MKKGLIIAGVIALAVAAYLLYPLVNVIEADEPSPAEQIESSPSPEADEPMMETARVVTQGALIEQAHEVEGRALLIEANGERYLRFEDLETVNGPDLRIYLSKDLTVDDAIDLGPVKATRGNVNYEIETDPAEYPYALIWCRAFGVLFSYARLQ